MKAEGLNAENLSIRMFLFRTIEQLMVNTLENY